MEIGNRIFDLRKWKKYSRKKLSEISGVSESAIKQYETGKRYPKDKQLQDLAKSLDTDEYYLRTGETLEERYKRLAESGKVIQLSPGDPEWTGPHPLDLNDIVDHLDRGAATKLDGEYLSIMDTATIGSAFLGVLEHHRSVKSKKVDNANNQFTTKKEGNT